MTYIQTNPLLDGIEEALRRIASFKEHVRELYFDVLLSLHKCPGCGGRLRIIGPSQCVCQCGRALDPTIMFQRSRCCQAALQRKRSHYACSHCGHIEPSKFLFDERIYDSEYFRERMRQHREQRQRKRDVALQRLAESHSDEWHPDTLALQADFDGFLDEHIESVVSASPEAFIQDNVFSLEQYRRMITRMLNGNQEWFSSLPSITPNPRLDKVRRFITLIFMENDRQVCLEEYDDDILVRPYETYD